MFCYINRDSPNLTMFWLMLIIPPLWACYANWARIVCSVCDTVISEGDTIIRDHQIPSVCYGGLLYL